MGNSASVRVVFGVKVEKTANPWYIEDKHTCHEDWWLKETGFVPSFYPYDDRGGYSMGVNKNSPLIKEYYDEKRKWEKEHPIPFGIEFDGGYDSDYGSDDIFVCYPNTGAYWDATELTKVMEKTKLEPAAEQRFKEFLKKYYDNLEPKWWVIPFYG